MAIGAFGRFVATIGGCSRGCSSARYASPKPGLPQRRRSKWCFSRKKNSDLRKPNRLITSKELEAEIAESYDLYIAAQGGKPSSRRRRLRGVGLKTDNAGRRAPSVRDLVIVYLTVISGLVFFGTVLYVTAKVATTPHLDESLMLKQVSPFAVPAYILFQISLVISTVVEFISTGVVLRAVLIVTVALPVLLAVGARPMPLGLTLPIGLFYCALEFFVMFGWIWLAVRFVRNRLFKRSS
jgi:hypothetical protein